MAHYQTLTWGILLLFGWHLALVCVGVASAVLQIYGAFQTTHLNYQQAVQDNIVQYFYPASAIPYVNITSATTYTGLAEQFFVSCGQYASAITLDGAVLTTAQQEVAQAQCLKSQAGLSGIAYAAGGLTIAATVMGSLISVGGLQKASWYFRITWINALSASVQLSALAIFCLQVWQVLSLLYDCSNLSESEALSLEKFSNLTCALGGYSSSGQGALKTAARFQRYAIYFVSGSLGSLAVTLGFWMSMYNQMQLTQSRLLNGGALRASSVSKEEQNQEAVQMDEINAPNVQIEA